MAIIESINIPAHHTIYNNYRNRELRIDFAIPESGTNEKTGILIFVPGFGGNIESKVYKKMRKEFADKYNMVTVQCDYFGSKFMQSAERLHLSNQDSIKYLLNDEEFQRFQNDKSELLTILKEKEVTVEVKAELSEDLNEFADMGFMQAIDIITAIEAIQIILNENNMVFNKKNIIGYGQSQGAFLLHLSNFLAPHLFSIIIDNAAWVKPVYLSSNRFLYFKYNKCTLAIEFDYLGKEVIKDVEALSLHNFYENFENGAYIYSCVGVTDNLIEVNDKKRSLKGVPFVNLEVIDQSKVDGEIFKSTNHGLDADFLKLFDYVINKKIEHINKNQKQEKYTVYSSQTVIDVNYSKGLPVFVLNKL